MTRPTETIVSTLTEFAGAIEAAIEQTRGRNPGPQLRNNWYRGHGRSVTYKLQPTLYRHPSIRGIRELLQLEVDMLGDFKRQSVLHNFPRTDDLFETLFYMQHYGVPTRLLDWTSNPFIALYFALADAKPDGTTGQYTEGVAVWILDPTEWNKKALEDLKWEKRGPATLEDGEIKSYRPLQKYEPADVKAVYDHPVAMLGISNSTRMFAQKGAFTVFGKSTTPMEEAHDASSFPAGSLSKVTVPKERIAAVFETLLSIGYTDSVSYPDLAGLAMEIRRLRGFRTS